MKALLKILACLCARISVLPLFLSYLLLRPILGTRRSFRSSSEWLSSIPGLLGEYIRREFYRLTLEKCSSSCCISYGCIIASPESRIGENVYIGPYSVLGSVNIGKNSLLASRVSIVSGTRQHGISALDIPIREQEGEYKQVTIGENCWIGEGAIIAADIGDNSILAAGGVAVKPIGESVIAGGNPAEVIRQRSPSSP